MELMFRSLVALFIGKLIVFLTRTLKLGGGSAAPGLYALKTDSQLIQRLVSQIPTNIIITGTNGKTTTARLLNHLLTKQGLKTIRNSTGSNLERGIASALLMKASFWGEIRHIDVGIWEVDEAAFNTLLPKIKPAVVVFLNAFRDQLDRYGEVDSVVRKWQTSLSQVEQSCVLLINGDDSNTSRLEAPKACSVEYYGLEGSKIIGERPSTPLRLDNAKLKRESKKVELTIKAKNIKLMGISGSDFKLETPENSYSVHLPLPGNYQIYNFLAAVSVYRSLNMPMNQTNFELTDFKNAFGRVEEIIYKGKKGYILLIKNPVGATSVFETISQELTSKDLILGALNDNFADGKDVSWIWDAEFEKLADQRTSRSANQLQIICSGIRAYDLANRFKYAGITQKNVQVVPELEKVFDEAFTRAEGNVYILPTYTALLELQKILANKRIKQHYWQEK